MVGSSLDVFLNGVVAGYGIAIPVGPIAVLILELGLRRGFRVALSAGAGAASADLIYATVAALAGTLIISVLAPFAFILRIGSGIGLVGMGAWLLYHRRDRSDRAHKPRLRATSCPQAYGMILGTNSPQPRHNNLLHNFDPGNAGFFSISFERNPLHLWSVPCFFVLAKPLSSN